MGRAFGRSAASYFDAISQHCARTRIVRCVGSISHEIRMKDLSFIQNILKDRPTNLSEDKSSAWIETTLGNSNFPQGLRLRIERLAHITDD